MPLVRVEVKNEYGLGAPELCKNADKEDPKTLLEGLAVAGLVGILRQLGDLAEFAAEVFHGIQEQVTITSSRSHKLMGRVKQIEAALPSLEKMVLAQTSHLHFAYTPGLNWRANLHNEQSHFIYSDLPRFMMSSYEQCRGPPNLNLLDKFDPGGPGSCLKRYSDPSFFRKTLKSSGLSQRKSRKIKKKRSGLRNGEISRRVSNYSGSINFPSLNTGEQTSPCPTVSTYELKDLDLGYQSLSFDSRNGSVDFEHVSQPRFSIPYKERHSTGSSSSRSRNQHKDSNNFTSTENNVAVLCCDSPSRISSEVVGFNSNQVTWDEKMEMLVGAIRENDQDEILEKSSTNLSFDNYNNNNYNYNNNNKEGGASHLQDELLDLENDDKLSNHFHTFEVNHEKGSLETLSTNVNEENSGGGVALETAAQMDILPENVSGSMEVPDDVDHEDDKNILPSNLGVFHRDEFESETDHFVDANIAIESEYESDEDFQTKQEMDQDSRVDINKNCDDEDTLTTPLGSGIISSIPEIVIHTNSSSKNDISGFHPDVDKVSAVKTNSVPFESQASLQPQFPDEVINPINSSNHIVGSSNVEFAVRNVSFLGVDVLVPGNDKNTCSPVLPKPPHESSTTSSTMLWTNGGLLGLEPSKPPDFTSVNTDGQVLGKIREETITYIPKSNVTEKIDTSLKEDALSESYQDDVKSLNLTRMAQRKSLSVDLGVNLLKLSDSYHQTYYRNTQNKAYTQPGDVQPVRPDMESSRASQEKSNSSKMFELGNKLLLNGFYSKPALLKDEYSYTDIPRYESPLISPPSSPPLGHMKISFQPINGSNAPNLQLKLPDKNFTHDGGRDLFTSFQLVPDPSIEYRDFGSDSDDDTFCQSSPYGSDHVSHQSDSNSEQWESHDSPKNTEKGLYDALCRISLTESVPESSGTSKTVNGEINNSNYTQLNQFPRDSIDSSYSNYLYAELPNLDSVRRSFKEMRQQYEDLSISQLPLRESQWQAMKPPLKLLESRQINLPENLGSTVTLKPKPAPQSQEEINGDEYLLKIKSQDLRKFTPGKSFSQPSKGNEEPKGDFLQQIRAKSLNLRRTAIPKPNVAADMTNVQVSAILEKANAIRKAVGSDREEDNWSDT